MRMLVAVWLLLTVACEVHTSDEVAASPPPPARDENFERLAREARERDEALQRARTQPLPELPEVTARRAKRASCEADADERARKREDFAAKARHDAELAGIVAKVCSSQRTDVTTADTSRLWLDNGGLWFDTTTQSSSRWTCPDSAPADVKQFAAERMTKARAKTPEEVELENRDRECAEVDR